MTDGGTPLPKRLRIVSRSGRPGNRWRVTAQPQPTSIGKATACPTSRGQYTKERER
jgi:hypothetical protein